MIPYIEKTFCGRTFRVTPETSAQMDDEEPMLRYLERVKPGDVFVDVGAGCGLYTLRAIAMGASVYAFEPFRDARILLGQNMNLNGWREPWPPRCTVHGSALFDGSPYPEELRKEVWGRHYPMEDPVKFEKLDRLGFDRLDMMKIDVEGAELGVLHGALETIVRCRPMLLVEDHDGINPDPACVVSRYAESIQSSKKIHEMLTAMNYRIEVLPWGCGRRFIVAEPKT